MANAPNVPGYGSSAPSTGGGTAAAPTTNPTQFQLKGFNQAFQLMTVQPGTTVPGAGPAKSSDFSSTGGKSMAPALESTNQKAPFSLQGKDVIATVQEYDNWSADQKNQFKNQAYQLGLTNSKNASATQVALAWQTVVETAAQEQKTPASILSAAQKAGSWNAMTTTSGVHPNDIGAAGSGNTNSQADGTTGSTTGSQGITSTQSQQNMTTKTSYTSYLDPATVQGTLADAYQRLMGRNPTPAEYKAFLDSVYSYENDANSGKFETGVVLKDGQKIDAKTGKVVDTKTGAVVPESAITRLGTDATTNTGDTNTQKNIVSQRGLGTRGAQFLAGQAAMQNPEEGTYQASTTYFNALIKALSGPAAGMSASGPTAMAP